MAQQTRMAAPWRTRIEVQHSAPSAEPAWTETGADRGVTQARLVFDTPLRLQQQGHPVRPQALILRRLAADLLLRITLLAEVDAGRPAPVLGARTFVKQAARFGQELDLRWDDWSCYSSKQQRKITLGGALITWPLSGELGLGAYRLEHPAIR